MERPQFEIRQTGRPQFRIETKQSERSHFERLEPVRELCVLLLKGDLAVLAGLGTFLTILNLRNLQMAEAIRHFYPTAFFLVLAITGAGLTLGYITADMVREDSEFIRIAPLVWFVLILHFLALGFILVDFSNYSLSLLAEERAKRSMPAVNTAVSRWVARTGEVPPAGSLYSTEAGIRLRHSLGGSMPDTLIYRKDSPGSYTVTFPGSDGEVGTNDDLKRGGVVTRDDTAQVVPPKN